ncbi:carboxypeptidase B-like isoform X5 [Eriocheir sinensis]|uniref:carboxypeptidase B-like isoform X2 n=1 Tax=Eriocheir sinensis TaxID=95602 RepID=UPI0021C7EED7|nr:carboxypeptidase B-like isoform X2 [Eriocheir sinensis]XP_050705553.1 carboxypeptidase B-like isoform X5 [Eriocheir sinensis]
MRVTVLLLLGLAALASAGTTSYHGHRLVSVLPYTQAGVDLVNTLVNTHHVQEWTHARGPGVPVDLLVPPRSFEALVSTMNRNGIPVTVKIDDVQAVIDQQMEEHRARKSASRAIDHTQYHTLEEIYSLLDELEAGYSLVTTYTAGTTYEGRDIRVAKVSTGGTKQTIWIDCGIHAREWISPATCLYILDQLTSGYGSDSEVTALLDTYDFHVMPSVNPDGYDFTWTSDRFWRKNRVPYEGILSCHGTDPNRNFNSSFGGPGTSDSPCSDIYHGPSPFSEKESQAVRDALSALDTKIYFSIHSYSQLWMTPYGYTYTLPANYDEQYRVSGIGVAALEAVHGTQYEYGTIADVIYQDSGSSSDWVYDGWGIQYSFSLELRDTGNYGFLLPAEQIIPTGEETWAGMIAAINAVI